MKRFFSGLFRFLFYSVFVLADILVILAIVFLTAATIPKPHPSDTSIISVPRTKVAEDMYTLNNSWLKKSDSGLWEIYIEGNGFERGVTEGKLGMELAHQQEEAFVGQIRKMIPSEKMLNYLKYFISFFNRNLPEHVPQEYQEEIYGEALFASRDFDFIAPGYYRMLNYHAAHDIGHALQDKNMIVGCTAFGAWSDKTDDHTLLIGRNFDFYVGDEFAKNKLIYFVRPDSGYKLMMVSWAGLIGAVSGMNEKGLTVTINASKSTIPTQAATPISLVAREILQYASSISEALAIAKKRKTFVSESILVGSVKDGRTATIEKTPDATELYESNTDYIVCANHYQGKFFKNDSINLKNISNSSSEYRREHLDQLLAGRNGLSVQDAADILRDTKGINERNIGLGNEKSLNQLIAHHSVIFKPECLQVWVSTSPYQLGQYICYDLNTVFAEAPGLQTKKELYDRPLNIAADPLLYSSQFKRFQAYRKMREALHFAHRHKLKYTIDQKVLDQFIQCNPEFWETYELLGDYYADQGRSNEARESYKKALTKEVTTKLDEDSLRKKIGELNLKAEI